MSPDGNRRCGEPTSGDRGQSAVTAEFAEPDGWVAVYLAPHGQTQGKHIAAYKALDDPRHAYGQRLAQQQTVETHGVLLVTAHAPTSLDGVWFGQAFGAGGRVDRPIG